VNNRDKNKHLLWRAGFGISTNDLPSINTLSANDLYHTIESKTLLPVEEIHFEIQNTDALQKNTNGSLNIKAANKIVSEKKLQAEIARDNLKNLNSTWIQKMVATEDQLREKMALFWHGHFACAILNPLYQQQLLHVIRTNALGNFKDLLVGVSKSAAMSTFLNNRQNIKEHPNENFAREVMELFTLGRGNYTEQDIKESARAFTGWSADKEGAFVFINQHHDGGEKVFFCKTGNYTGDDILEMILEKKQTAHFIAAKIYRYFVNEQTPNEKHIKWLGERFYNSNYDIKALMRDVFTADWFYDEANIGSKIKSPIELIVGIQRLLPMEITNKGVLMILQRNLGQVLFSPPNVAGWPGGTTWIDSSTLLLRLKTPEIMMTNKRFNIKPKQDDDTQMGQPERFNTAKDTNGITGFETGTKVNWDIFISKVKTLSGSNPYDFLRELLLQVNKPRFNKNSVVDSKIESITDDYIRQLTLNFMSTPEYQMC
jgi:uncharacterized protein (DUF1800 family)